MLRYTFSTASIHTYGTARTFEIAKQAGFDGMELMIDYRPDTRDADYIRRLIDRYQIPVLSVHSPFSIYAQGWGRDDAEAVQRTVKMAETLDAEAVVVHLPPKVDFTSIELIIGSWRKRMVTLLPGSRFKRLRRWMETEFDALQDSTRVELCVENLPAHVVAWNKTNLYFWNPISMQQLESIKRFRALTMDTTHLATWGLEPAEVYPHWNSHIRHVHLSNYDGQEHRLPEEGRLRLDRLIHQLARDRFDGTITLELYPAVCGAGKPDCEVIDRLAKSLQTCHSWENSQPSGAI